ncbi:MAG: MIP/aquaporin family protein [Bacteroidia bacterium]
MKKYISEIIATFFLVFVGTGSVIIDHISNGKITLAGISIITGAIVSVMIILFGSLSGAHMNPAVTIALARKGEIQKKDIFPYILAQGIGAFAGSLLLKILFSNSTTLGETLPSVNIYIAFLIEVGLTLFLMLVILIVSAKTYSYSAWIIGATVAIGIFIGGNYSGGSMNPIRSLSPAILNHNVGTVWIFLTAPFIGALIALSLFNLFKK